MLSYAQKSSLFSQMRKTLSSQHKSLDDNDDEDSRFKRSLIYDFFGLLANEGKETNETY
jgi:hypothetical protein